MDVAEKREVWDMLVESSEAKWHNVTEGLISVSALQVWDEGDLIALRAGVPQYSPF